VLFTILALGVALAGAPVPIDEEVARLQQTYDKTRDFQRQLYSGNDHSINKEDRNRRRNRLF